MSTLTESEWIEKVDHLAENDWVVMDNFLPEDVYGSARAFLIENLELENFKPAGIGAQSDFQIEKSIRSDRIFWLDRNKDTELESFFALVDDAISRLNQLCYLSISGMEFHLAHYSKGTFYKKHLDQFSERNNRLISMICYLNKSWSEGDGGELGVYDEQGNLTKIAPLPGRMVLLRSDRVYHEVFSTNVSRYSITGWLLHKPAGLGYLFG